MTEKITGVPVQVRTLASTADQVQVTSIQNQMVSAADVFRAQIESEIALRLSTGGFSAADQLTARTTIIAAVKAVLW
jgi:phosphoribosylformylglycinamidine (FGAM) synthase-like amidotransferase family enzyme